jgi:cobalt-precorrin 5A hydrolase
MNKLNIAILTINQPSLDSACNLSPYLNNHQVDIFCKKNLQHNLKYINIYNKLEDILSFAWKKYDAIICILATGAIIRKIAPLLSDKLIDPAILVINLDLNKIIPLLSGHLGGANKLASELTNKLPNCINFITTATDQTNTIAFDIIAKNNNWQIENIKQLAYISNRLLNKLPVKILTKKNIFDSLPNKNNLELITPQQLDKNTVIISPIIEEKNLTLKPKVYLGIGCNRDTSFTIIDMSIKIFLTKYNLTIEQIEAIASFEAKEDEKGLLNFAKEYNIDIKFYKKDDINSLENKFSDSASTKFFGLQGVAEPCAILCSQYKELIIKKQVYNKSVTISAAI